MPERAALARNISLDFDVNSKIPQRESLAPRSSSAPGKHCDKRGRVMFPCWASCTTAHGGTASTEGREHPLGQMGLVSLQCGNLLLGLPFLRYWFGSVEQQAGSCSVEGKLQPDFIKGFYSSLPSEKGSGLCNEPTDLPVCWTGCC